MNAFKSFITASLLCLPLMHTALASDSTNIPTPGVTTIMPQTVVNESDCTLSDKISANDTFGTGGGGKPVTSTCPTGYIATGMKAYMSTPMPDTKYYWQTECCKSYVTYQK